MPELRLAKAREGYEGYVYQPPKAGPLLNVPEPPPDRLGLSIRFAKQWDITIIERRKIAFMLDDDKQ
jgi:hypothetical protein